MHASNNLTFDFPLTSYVVVQTELQVVDVASERVRGTPLLLNVFLNVEDVLWFEKKSTE